jgi:hypothetical protein
LTVIIIIIIMQSTSSNERSLSNSSRGLYYVSPTIDADVTDLDADTHMRGDDLTTIPGGLYSQLLDGDVSFGLSQDDGINHVNFTVPMSSLESSSTFQSAGGTAVSTSVSTSSQSSPSTPSARSQIWSHFTYSETTKKWACKLCLAKGLTR